MADVHAVEVDEDGRATLPREVLAAALAEPGDLIECWATGPQEIVIKVVFRIPMTGTPDRGEAPGLAPSGMPPIITKFPEGRPVLTIDDMREAREQWARVWTDAAAKNGAGAPTVEQANGGTRREETVGGRAGRRPR
jgi:hypothetical protein